jgi:hypothetical protein
MMENLRNIPTEVAGRAIRLLGGGTAVSTQRDWKSSLSSFLVFLVFSFLVFFFFHWCWSQQVKEQKEMRIITDSSSRAPHPWLQWH